MNGLATSTLGEKASEVLNTMACGEEQHADRNSVTVGQSKSSDWFRLRSGHVTACNLKTVLYIH